MSEFYKVVKVFFTKKISFCMPIMNGISIQQFKKDIIEVIHKYYGITLGKITIKTDDGYEVLDFFIADVVLENNAKVAIDVDLPTKDEVTPTEGAVQKKSKLESSQQPKKRSLESVINEKRQEVDTQVKSRAKKKKLSPQKPIASASTSETTTDNSENSSIKPNVSSEFKGFYLKKSDLPSLSAMAKPILK